MIKKYTFFLLITIMISSCGKSKQEIELEKTKLELERTKLELIEKNKNEELEKIKEVHEQKVNVGKRKKITDLQMELQTIPDKIEIAKQNISKIEKFQIGRSSSTKNKQLKQAHEYLNEIRTYGEKLKNEIAQLEYFKTFDFQKTPGGVLNHIFQSAKNGDFSNFRYLCDPYLENDSDVNQFCYIELLTEKRKEEFKKEFESGRIIGEPKITADIAEVEFAFGASSNKLEKMSLIKRNGFWYISGF